MGQTFLPDASNPMDLRESIYRLQGRADGLWTDIPLTNSSLRIDGASNTWVWKSHVNNNIAYMLVGRSMLLNVFIFITTTLPTATTRILIPIPDGYQVAHSSRNGLVQGEMASINTATKQPTRAYLSKPYMYDGGGHLSDPLLFTNEDPLYQGYVQILRQGGANLVAGDTLVWGQLWMEVQPLGGL